MHRLIERYNELGEMLSLPDIIANPSRMMELAKERSIIEPKVDVFTEYEDLSEQLEGAELMIREETDSELCEMARAEKENLEERIAAMEEDIKVLLLPPDPLDGSNIIMEIRAGTGGEEAALFASDLYKMYTHFADSRRWRTEIMSTAPSEAGGFKEVIFSIAGEDVYSWLKYESGVHRVQRVPATETSGRIHTSAASVVVLPEAEDVNIHIDQNDLKIDVYRSSGPGGQSVNTTDSAVRITHIPTGTVVTCQDEKSQLKNKTKALKVLKARLYEKARDEQMSERSATRKSMVGSGDRSAKIRTYNFPQSRVTDHRIGLTLHRLEAILSGDLEDIIQALRLEDRKVALEQQAKELV